MPGYSYYPGCSLAGMGKPYDESVRAVFSALGLELEEIEDWNCCGATSYMTIDEVQAVALAARNLAIAEKAKKDLVAPCAACFLVLTKAQHLMAEYPELGDKARAALQEADLPYHGMVNVRHPLDVLVNDVSAETLSAKVQKPLTGYKVAPYYGCQVLRPYETFDNAQNPKTLEKLLTTLGATVVEYPLKTRCCGGSLMGTVEDVAIRLNFLLLKEAKFRGANMIATLCPLCQFNLEAYQDKMKKQSGEDVSLPVVYFTQLVGVALGLKPSAIGLQRNFVTAPPLPATA